MNELTLPGLARKRRALDPHEALIPCATATHLTGDRHREPTFEDLLAGNDREPSHTDLLVDDEDDQDLTPAARELPIAYPGAGADTIAWLREQDRPAERDRHAFDTDRLIPVGQLVTMPLPAPAAVPPAPPAIEMLPLVGNPRLLFDALDALDRLPALFFTDAEAFEMATSIAAIQTYVALRPDLAETHEFRMQLAPLTAELAEALPESPEVSL